MGREGEEEDACFSNHRVCALLWCCRCALRVGFAQARCSSSWPFACSPQQTLILVQTSYGFKPKSWVGGSWAHARLALQQPLQMTVSVNVIDFPVDLPPPPRPKWGKIQVAPISASGQAWVWKANTTVHSRCDEECVETRQRLTQAAAMAAK